MVEIKWTARAISDITEIAEYISKDSFHYASGVVDRIFSQEEYLKNDTYYGRIVPEFNNKNIREVITGNYRIVYRVFTSTKIQILTVQHGARKITKRSLK